MIPPPKWMQWRNIEQKLETLKMFLIILEKDEEQPFILQLEGQDEEGFAHCKVQLAMLLEEAPPPAYEQQPLLSPRNVHFISYHARNSPAPQLGGGRPSRSTPSPAGWRKCTHWLSDGGAGAAGSGACPCPSCAPSSPLCVPTPHPPYPCAHPSTSVLLAAAGHFPLEFLVRWGAALVWFDIISLYACFLQGSFPGLVEFDEIGCM